MRVKVAKLLIALLVSVVGIWVMHDAGVPWRGLVGLMLILWGNNIAARVD